MFVDIKFSGPPGSGKTIALEICKEALRKAGHTAKQPEHDQDGHELRVFIVKVQPK